jgi:uncharacterized protein (DUF305 family)
MQLNIDRKTGALLGLIVLLAAAVVSLSVNRNENNVMNNSSGHMGHGTSSSSNANYTGADIMFLQMMIPHHQQAIDISNLAMKASSDPELLELAKIIARDQAAEIKQMKAWLKDAGASEDMGHSMDGMGGMLNEDDLAALSAATGKEFDTLWLKGMTEHHDGAIHMTQMIEDAQNADIKAFGTKVIKDQSDQIDQMKKMLARL